MEKILAKFGMNNVKLVNLPVASHFKISLGLSPRNDEEKEYMSHVPYGSTLGNLMYVMVSTRHDILHVVGVLSSFMENIGKEHWRAVEWVPQYFGGISDHCIIFNGFHHSVYGYVDSDYVGELENMRSTTRYVFNLVAGAISWMSEL